MMRYVPGRFQEFDQGRTAVKVVKSFGMRGMEKEGLK